MTTSSALSNGNIVIVTDITGHNDGSWRKHLLRSRNGHSDDRRARRARRSEGAASVIATILFPTSHWVIERPIVREPGSDSLMPKVQQSRSRRLAVSIASRQ